MRLQTGTMCGHFVSVPDCHTKHLHCPGNAHDDCSPADILRKTLQLFVAPQMRPLALVFLYTGLSNAFWSGPLPG